MLIRVRSGQQGGTSDDTQQTVLDNIAGKVFLPMLRYIAVHLLQYDKAHSFPTCCANVDADGTITPSRFYINAVMFFSFWCFLL